MDGGERLALQLDFWDDAVGAFEPAKVLEHLARAFPDAQIDPTDHQRVRLLRELEFWACGESADEFRDGLVRQSWGLYQRNGPTYRFVIPFPSGHRVAGGARRQSVCFQVPDGLPPENREQLLSFLRSLRMGEPALGDGDEKVESGGGGGRSLLDEGSRNVVAFLEGVQAVREELHAVWNYYVRRGLKVSNFPNSGPIWALDGHFDLGLLVTGADGRNYELSARLRWSGGEWVVQADASLEQENECGDWAYPVLRELPERRASEWPAALAHWRAAVAGLAGFDNLIAGQ